MDFIVTCTPGLEEISMRELDKKFGIKSHILHKGAISFRGKEEHIYLLNYLGKTIHKVIIKVGEGEVHTLGDIYKFSKDLPFEEFIPEKYTFGVKTKRFGEHDFSSMDISKEIGQAVIDRIIEKRKERVKVNLSQPDIQILAELRDKKLWIGIDTTGESLHKRWYRKNTFVTSLRSTIAHSMVMISEVKKSLYDPLCGTGMIPIEAYHFFSGKPNKYRNFSFEKFSWIDKEKFEKIKAEYKERDVSEKIFASDWNRDVVLKAKENSKIAEADVKFFINDVRKFLPQSETIVTDLPYGIRMKRYDLYKFYRRFFEAVKDKYEKLVFITAKRSMRFFPRKIQINIEKRYELKYGEIDAVIFVGKR